MKASAEFGHFATAKQREQLLRFVPNSAKQVIIIEPLLEERNFLRRMIINVARRLASRDIGSVTFDLPGCGESLADTSAVDLDDWRTAVADVCALVRKQSGISPHIASFRGGALLDHVALPASVWRFAPATGAELLRPFQRANRLSNQEQDANFGGYGLNSKMVEQLEQAIPEPLTVRTRETEVRPDGIAPWRRAEPGDDPLLAKRLADDLADWIEACAAV